MPLCKYLISVFDFVNIIFFSHCSFLPGFLWERGNPLLLSLFILNLTTFLDFLTSSYSFQLNLLDILCRRYKHLQDKYIYFFTFLSNSRYFCLSMLSKTVVLKILPYKFHKVNWFLQNVSANFCKTLVSFVNLYATDEWTFWWECWLAIFLYVNVTDESLKWRYTLKFYLVVNNMKDFLAELCKFSKSGRISLNIFAFYSIMTTFMIYI